MNAAKVSINSSETNFSFDSMLQPLGWNVRIGLRGFIYKNLALSKIFFSKTTFSVSSSVFDRWSIFVRRNRDCLMNPRFVESKSIPGLDPPAVTT